MKTVFVLLLTLLCMFFKVECKDAVLYDLTKGKQLFQQFKRDFGKRYCSAADRDHRYRLFYNSLKQINTINSDPNGNYFAKITQYADLTAEDVQKCCMGPSFPGEDMDEAGQSTNL